MSEKKDKKNLNRRELPKSGAFFAMAGAGLTASPLVGAAAKKASGANDRIRVGVLGPGKQGRSNMMAFAHNPEVEIAAVCDCYKPNLDLGLKALAEAGKPVPKTFADFRKVLELKDIDAVIVASPDHWHPAMSVMACQAGKDVYVEKPVSVCVAEGRKMVEAARKYERVVGVGTQQRSGKHFQRAVELVQSGRLGKVTEVRTWNYGNEFPAGIGNPPDSEPPAGLDWDMWLGPAPKVPFNINRFGVVDDGRWSSFRWFWDYAGGWPTDWGTHLIDIVLWAMKQKGPRRVSGMGRKFLLQDNRDTPDTMLLCYEFPEFILTYECRRCSGESGDGHGYGIEFHGTDGSLYVNREGYSFRPEKEDKGDETFDKSAAFSGGESEQHATHVKAYIECLKTRKRFISDIEDGHLASATPHLGNLSLRLGRSLQFDPETERILNDPEADRMLMRQYRAPWTLEV